MAKRYDEAIEVAADGGGAAPIAFRWRGRSYDVDLELATWREAGEWWDRERVYEREYHRVIARPASHFASGDLDPDGFMVRTGGVYDLYRDRLQGTWHLARIWD